MTNDQTWAQKTETDTKQLVPIQPHHLSSFAVHLWSFAAYLRTLYISADVLHLSEDILPLLVLWSLCVTLVGLYQYRHLFKDSLHLVHVLCLSKDFFHIFVDILRSCFIFCVPC